MIEARAQVIGVDGDQLLLQAESTTSCSGCGVRQGCGTSVLSRWIGRRFTRFTVTNTVDARAGDEVIVGISEDALLGGSLAVYLLPLLAMILAALAADSILVADAEKRDLLVSLFAAGGFALALWGSRAFLAGAGRRNAMRPVVLRKLGAPVAEVPFVTPDTRPSDTV